MSNFINQLFPSGSGIFVRKIQVLLFNVDENFQPIQPAIFSINTQGRSDDFRVSFKVTNNMPWLGNPDKSQINIYNLSERHRNFFRNNTYAYNISVGYDKIASNNQSTLSDLITLSWGGVSNIYTTREDANYKTTIIGYEAANGMSIATTRRVAAATSLLSDFLKALAEDIPGVELVEGDSTDLDNVTFGSKGRVFVGKTTDILANLAREFGFRWTVRNSKLLVFSDYINDPNAFSNSQSASGLVFSQEQGNLLKAVPIVNNVDSAIYGINLTSVLDPRVFPGVYIQIKSLLNPGLNDLQFGVGVGDATYYQVSRVEHSGDSHSMDFTSQIECLAGGQPVVRSGAAFDSEPAA